MGVTDNESREIPKRNQKERKLIGMKSAILFTLATLTWASPAPQYSGQTQDLSEGQLDTIKDIFGTDAGDAYSGDQQTGFDGARHRHYGLGNAGKLKQEAEE